MRREISDEQERDQEKHPHCQYSSSIRKSCSNNSEGKFVCETVQNLLRYCPGQQPKLVFEKKTVGFDASMSMKDMFDFGSFFNQRPSAERTSKEDRVNSSPLDILAKVENEILRSSSASRPRANDQQNKYTYAPASPEPDLGLGLEGPPQFDFPHSDVFDKEVEKALKKGKPKGPVEHA